MTNETQHIVFSIQGTEELLHRTEELFQHKEKKIEMIENGFQVHVQGLPYYFQLSCFEEIGWNVFLTSLTDSIEDDEETDGFYHQLEDAVDGVNAQYFIEDMEQEKISYHFFKLKSFVTDTFSPLDEVKEVLDTGKYVLKIAFEETNDSLLEMGYSHVFKRWYYEFSNKETQEWLLKYDIIRQYVEEIDYLIGNLNQIM